MAYNEVRVFCKEVFARHPSIFKHDKVARRQYWADFTDALCKDGSITQKQYNEWNNPF